MASVCRWEGKAKLANLVTRLQGQAYAFYRTCPSHQRTYNEALNVALTEQFKPVCIKSMQSGLFHERKQQAKENVKNMHKTQTDSTSVHIPVLRDSEAVLKQKNWAKLF